MYIVPIAWIYVALMMAVAEATSSQGTFIGAVFTFLLYGVLPVSILIYLMGTPLRRKQRLQQEAAVSADSIKPDESSHAASAADVAPSSGSIAPVRKEP
jgi:hypothetical protein